MAGNKVNPKTKDRGKFSKPGGSGKDGDDVPAPDFSLLRKPIATSITGFGQARKVFEKGTDELRSLLTRECDIVYECKVCRNLFRSLANFISHKRVYCQEKFNASVHARFSRCTVDETMKIMKLEEEYQDFVKNKKQDQHTEQEINPPLTKDITAMLERTLVRDDLDPTKVPCRTLKINDIPSSSTAVFQNIGALEKGNEDNMRKEVNELNKIMTKDCAILRADGKFDQVAESDVMEVEKQQLQVADSENIIQISDDEDESGNLVCKICSVTFSTMKTYKFHMKCKHLENRKVYPCPDCLDLFSTSWSVFRHLFKVHRKTAAQIRRLRDSIQAKAFRLNEPPAFYERRRNIKLHTHSVKITEEERIDQENQAWMENMELDGEVPRCGGCGRRFERRAALAAHTHTCQQRQNAIRTRTPIHIQVRRDYNKTARPITEKPSEESVNDASLNKDLSAKENNSAGTDKKEASAIQGETAKENENEDDNEESKDNEGSYNKAASNDKAESNDKEDSSEKEDGSEKEDTINKDDEKDLDEDEEDSIDSLEQIDMKEKNLSIVLAQTIEKENLEALKGLMQDKIEASRSYCKICCRKYSNMHSLFRHMAQHYSWKRYACKLCNYACFERDKMPLHAHRVHKLKGTPEFYSTTMKILTADEAMRLRVAAAGNELESDEVSPASRIESRCSSASSRLSDNESNSGGMVTEAAKRKRNSSDDNCSSGVKRQRDEKTVSDASKTESGEKPKVDTSKPISMHKVMQVIFGDNNDGNKEGKRNIGVKNLDTITMTRRPIRKKSKPKHADFEYDLSNLLKLEADSYREAQYTGPSQNKKDPLAINQKGRESIGLVKSVKRKSSNESLETTPTKMDSQDGNATTPPNTSPLKIHTNAVINLSVSAISQARAHPSFYLSAKAGVAKPNPLQHNKTAPVKVFKIPVKMQPLTESKLTISKEVNSNEVIDLENENNDKVNPKDTERNNEATKPNSNLDIIKNPIVNQQLSKLTQGGAKTKILVIKGPFSKSNSVPVKVQAIKPIVNEDLKKVIVGNSSSNSTSTPKCENTVKKNVTKENGDTSIVSNEEIVENNDNIEDSIDSTESKVKEITDPVTAVTA